MKNILDSCWAWDGSHRKADGRPIAKHRYAYRLIYQAMRGPIARGLLAHHRCEHPWCVNPWHIELLNRARHWQAHGIVGGDWGERDKTHCPAGHPYTEANTYRWRNERHCRACRSAAKARYNANRKIER